ncbi:ureidoglycolate lyase [Pseudomarimonas arenosa]|uniref:Ureidoglycolate lyase n=1 Tax=Pseudomarimonas arenosa TaxID=2774145 RepID=A0AAW3ZHW1_9GAMM|nr:ureidoglycolate lyase [Pseudomarimonas arenosa]MBD8525663.1 ureidoglycolate lyase [Pseudomarimonas arenosa]
MSAARKLAVETLSAEAFAAFGDVIAPEQARQTYPINQGTSMRYHDLAKVDVGDQGGRPLISIFRAEPRQLPFEVRMLERHPLGSQAFVPLSPALRYIVVVAEHADATPRAFLAAQGQGVNFAKGVWHHPLLALDQGGDFLVVDRGGSGENCDERAWGSWWLERM